MFNYSYIFPSFLILIVFVVYCFYIPRINIGMNRIYIQLIVVEAVVMITDIASSMADENYYNYEKWQLYLINELFFLFFFFRAYLFYIITYYILKLHHHLKNVYYHIMKIPFWAAVILTVSTSLTGYVFYISEDGYHRGIIYDYVIYSCLIFYVVVSFAIILAYRKSSLNIVNFSGAIGYNLTILFGICVRKMFPSYLLFDTFCLIALIVIYLSFTNPDFYFNRKTNTFNINALQYFVEEISDYRYYRYLAIGIHNYKEMRDVYGSSQMDKGLSLIGLYFKKEFKDYKTFYCGEGRFAIIGKRDIDSSTIINDINNRFKEAWKLKDNIMYLEVDFVQTAEDMSVESPEKRVYIGLDMLSDYTNSIPGNVRYVRNEDVENADRQAYIRKTLKWVIENEKAEVYLQPIVRADTHEVEGAEALARIKDPEGNRIMPGEFIHIAEKNGAINQLGEQIFKKTCKYIKENGIDKMGISWINVNLSPMQFMNNSLADKFNAIINTSGIDVSHIHLEITEEAMVDQFVLERQIGVMKESGFKFVLDDYGKGYSNLDRLKSIPFINIKIDMAIVRDYCNNPDKLLPSVIQTFKIMGFTVTAEGIETEEMADAMYKIGCDYLQGYLFSPPVPIEEFADILK